MRHGTAAVAALLVLGRICSQHAEQRAACKRDTVQFCAAEIPNMSRITSCMKANDSRLSAGCKAVMGKG
jgi:hypothetical protein